jgi:hypothetical protein
LLTNSAATPYIEESKWLPIMGNRRRPAAPRRQHRKRQ